MLFFSALHGIRVEVQNKIASNIAKRQPWLRSAGVVRILSLVLLLFLPACSLVPSISIVKDEPIERLLKDEAERILAVTEDATNTSKYQIALSDSLAQTFSV